MKKPNRLKRSNTTLNGFPAGEIAVWSARPVPTVTNHYRTASTSPVVKRRRPDLGPKPDIHLEDLPFQGT
jgi:hypothetical protein